VHSAAAVAIAAPLHEPALVQGLTQTALDISGVTQTALDISGVKGHGSTFEGADRVGVSSGGGTGCVVCH
jgi:hypothetical protein